MTEQPKQQTGHLRRRLSRIMVVQALYARESGEGNGADTSSDAAQSFLREAAGGGSLKPDKALFAKLTEGVLESQSSLDALIAAIIPADQKIDRLDPVLLAILRAAAYEADARRETPAPALISEYVAVAESLIGGPPVAFAHALLDKIFKEIRGR